ncbi:MAG: tripartite tricarboxylate transporter substrate-binding protein, partial [Xanthobacteraceae bacterium]
MESAWGQGCASYPSRVPKSDGSHCRCVSRFAQCLCAKLLSGFPPGGINDTYARLIGQRLSEHLGQQFIIENHPGVGGNLAAETVAKAEPDGYTLLLTTPADAWNATLYNNLNFNYARDFTPVATMIESGYPTFDMPSWGGFLAPAGTPREIVAKLNREIQFALARPDVEQRML